MPVKVTEIFTRNSTSSKLLSSATKYTSQNFSSAPWGAVHAASISYTCSGHTSLK